MPYILAFFILQFFSTSLNAQSSKIDSLYATLNELKNKNVADTNLYNIYMKLGYHTHAYNLDSALHYHQSAKMVAYKLKDNYNIGFAFYQTGNDYTQFGEYEKAISAYDSVLIYAQKLIDSKNEEENKKGIKLRANAFKSAGYIKMVTGDYKAALDVFYKGLKIAEESRDTNGMAIAYNSIGMILENQNKIEKADVFYKKAYEYFVLTNDKRNQAGTINNIGNIYGLNKDYSNAKKYYSKALKLNEELGNKVWEATNLGNLGVIAFEENQYQKALEYFFRGLKIKEETNDMFGLALMFLNIGNSYIDLHDTKNAELYVNKAYEIGKAINAIEFYRDCNKTLSTIYEKSQPAKSLEHYKLYVQYRDSITNDENTQAIFQKEMQYEYEKKEATLKAEQEKKEAIAQAEKSRQQLFMLLIGAVAIAIAIIALVVYRSLSITKKQKEVIEQQKIIVEEKQKEILDSIFYARRIQMALLTPEKYIERKLNELKK